MTRNLVEKRSAVSPEEWRDALMGVLSQLSESATLRDAALSEDLKQWTSLLTGAVVSACRSLDLVPSAKGFRSNHLPQSGEEFLGMDVMAFATLEDSSISEWQFPSIVFELENSSQDDRVAYSLWKVLCVRAPLRVVFAYRKTWELCADLVRALTDQVVRLMPKADYFGETVLVIGSRAEGESFPWGYFKFYALNKNLMKFEKI